MSLIVKYPNAGTITEVLENIKDIAIQMPSKADWDNLVNRVSELETSNTAIQAKLDAGVTDNTHYVCDDDNLYDSSKSKVITIVNGIITAIET